MHLLQEIYPRAYADITVGAWVVRQRYDDTVNVASMTTSSPELDQVIVCSTFVIFAFGIYIIYRNFLYIQT